MRTRHGCYPFVRLVREKFAVLRVAEREFVASLGRLLSLSRPANRRSLPSSGRARNTLRSSRHRRRDSPPPRSLFPFPDRPLGGPRVCTNAANEKLSRARTHHVLTPRLSSPRLSFARSDQPPSPSSPARTRADSPFSRSRFSPLYVRVCTLLAVLVTSPTRLPLLGIVTRAHRGTRPRAVNRRRSCQRGQPRSTIRL